VSAYLYDAERPLIPDVYALRGCACVTTPCPCAQQVVQASYGGGTLYARGSLDGAVGANRAPTGAAPIEERYAPSWAARAWDALKRSIPGRPGGPFGPEIPAPPSSRPAPSPQGGVVRMPLALSTGAAVAIAALIVGGAYLWTRRR
jgi:hypothetical protein